MNGGSSAPAITGKRPTQAPAMTFTGGFNAILISNVTLNANFRYESVRWADDQNTLRLAPATTVNARIAWAFASNWSVFVQGDNLFDANVATTKAADLAGTTNYGTPRLIQAGLSFIE
jgi:outer membrane receptor protein involved in Fe transport